MAAPGLAEPRYFADATAFRGWLATHADTAAEILVGYHKVGSGKPGMTWSESVDEALCVGWIDGVRRRIDDDRYCIRFTPRRPGSIWSAINLAKVETLTAEGRMQPAGLAAHARRREAKSVVYSYEQEARADLTAAELRRFRRDKVAWAYFEQVPPGYRHQIVHWVTAAKRAETRARRLEALVTACAAGLRLR